MLKQLAYTITVTSHLTGKQGEALYIMPVNGKHAENMKGFHDALEEAVRRMVELRSEPVPTKPGEVCDRPEANYS